MCKVIRVSAIEVLVVASIVAQQKRIVRLTRFDSLGSRSDPRIPISTREPKPLKTGRLLALPVFEEPPARY